MLAAALVAPRLTAQTPARTLPRVLWPDWEAFCLAFVDASGRVIDWTDTANPGRTVSEAQAYALFFALVANDRARFASILAWTENNLARGDLTQNPPAWLWGRREDETYGVLDPNTASDADLWLAHTLLEAGRLWHEVRYAALGHSLLMQARSMVVRAPGGGPLLLLPGREGFVRPDAIRINPSYYVPAQLIYFSRVDSAGPWAALLADYLRLLPVLAPLGRLPDWAQWQDGRLRADPGGMGSGSYDAIRVYLWAGMGSGASVGRYVQLLRGFAEMTAEVGRVPERWSLGNAGISGEAPVGFLAALAPYHLALGESEESRRLRERVAALRNQGLYGPSPARYYDQVLSLFGLGLMEDRYRFDADGRLRTRWQA